MRITDLSHGAPGELLELKDPQHPEARHAFLPLPLPERLPLGLPVVEALANAEHALGRLDEVLARPGLPEDISSLLAICDALSSSRLDGLILDEDCLLRRRATPEKPKPENSSIYEAEAHIEALHFGENRPPFFELNLRFVQQIHGVLLQSASNELLPGKLRKTQTFVQKTQKTQQPHYVPPPPGKLNKLMEGWQKSFQANSPLPVLVQCALLHYQFEAIHPFTSGNGRLGRLLIPLYLRERGRVTKHGFSMGRFFQNHKDEYFERLLAVSRDGDWEGWLAFFLRGVHESARDTHALVLKLETWLSDSLQKLEKKGRALELHPLLEHLAVSPYITVPLAVVLLQTSFPTGKASLKRLEDAGIIEAVPTKKRPKLFCAKGIIELL